MLSRSVASAVTPVSSSSLLPNSKPIFCLKTLSGYRSSSFCGGCIRKINHKPLRMTSSNITPRAMATQQLENADQLIDSVETFIFDCDGQYQQNHKMKSDNHLV